uniref:Adhesion molecule with Ig like domain 2 n=1 Tax=Ornithorhynchus anatinus TaxID=9258 RepID=A0A6I8N297_ORNAN
EGRDLLCLAVMVTTVGAGAPGTCPSACVCATDVVSCAGESLAEVPADLYRHVKRLDLSHNRIGWLDPEWMPALLELNALIVRQNNITGISAGSFSSTPNLRCLDLSSNKLRTLGSPVFQELKLLEVLLLYNNRIAHLDPAAFGGLPRLRKLYLSGNALTRFPLDLYVGKFKLPQLGFLDVSHNRLSALPIHRLHLVATKQLSGVYLHGNPFVCDCALYSLFTSWYRRHFSAVTDFKKRIHLSFPLMQDGFLNCSDGSAGVSLGSVHEAQVGEKFIVRCDSKLSDSSTDFVWILPGERALEPGREMENFRVFPNGSLEIESARFEDAGVYSCIAVDRQRPVNETVEVRINVNNFTQSKSHAHEAFNTAFTTLAACVASIVLVLLYLYLTPCPCQCKAKRQKRKPNQNSVVLNAVPPGDPPVDERKPGTGKRVVFLEPLKDPGPGQNGKSILKTTRVKSDSDSINSVFSDTPFVAPS